MKTCYTCRYCRANGYYLFWGIKAYWWDLKRCIKCKLCKSQWEGK